MTSIALSVYEPDAATLIAHVAFTRNRQFLDELNGDGHGQFEIHLDNEVLTRCPTLLAGGNIVKMRPTSVGAPVVAWQIESVSQALTPNGERADRWAIVKGRGVRTLLATGQLWPEHGLAAQSADDRGFGPASDFGVWDVPADWVAPEGVVWTADPTAREGYPLDWPDATAEWIWSTDPTATAAAGRNWFRGEFTLGADSPVGFYVAVDNVLALYVDGDLILETDPRDLFNWKQMHSLTLGLEAGTHTITAQVDNSSFAGANPGGFLCTVATLDSQGIPVTVLTRTNTTDWLAHGYGPPEPGWHTASILKAVIEESQARSEAQIMPLTLGFDDTDDSDSQPWTDIQNERFPIGGDLLTMLGRLIELGMDVDVTPDLVVNAWSRKGDDLTDSVWLRPGRDIVSHVPDAQYGALRNSALVRHGTGWLLVEDSASITAHGRRTTFLSAGSTDSDTQGQQLAEAVFEETATPQVTFQISLTSAAGPQPYVDFVKGDIISAPDETGTLVPARVMSIAAADPDPNVIAWDVDLYPEV